MCCRYECEYRICSVPHGFLTAPTAFDGLSLTSLFAPERFSMVRSLNLSGNIISSLSW